jgi:hypothetical protein
MHGGGINNNRRRRSDKLDCDKSRKKRKMNEKEEEDGNDGNYVEVGLVLQQLKWLKDLQTSFNSSIILDRHYLYDIEKKTRIAAIATTSCGDNVQLALAQKYNLLLNFRELPVSLLRLYFLGQFKFDYWLIRLPVETINELFTLLERDGYNTPLEQEEEEEEEDGNEISFMQFVGDNSPSSTPKRLMSLEYMKKLYMIRKYLILIFNLCFSSFEKCLHGITEILISSLRKRSNKWPSFGLFDNLTSLQHFKYIPHQFKQENNTIKSVLLSNHLIWLVSLWRINVALAISDKIKPWLYHDKFRSIEEEDEEKEYLIYKLRLFRDTHLDLITEVIARDTYDDDVLKKLNIFYECYPSCQRVCVADDLPDLSCYAFENLKKGPNLKERSSLMDMIGHLLWSKAMNNICKIRNLHKIIYRYGKSYPIIIEILKLISKCILLGNIPKSKGELDLIARVRINFSFYKENTDKIDDSGCVILDDDSDEDEEDEEDEEEEEGEEGEDILRENGTVHSDEEEEEEEEEKAVKKKVKKKKKKKKKKKQKSQSAISTKKTVFITWIYKYRHLVSFILKEYSFFSVESSGIVFEILGCNNKYLQYVKIGRMALGRFRDEFTRQCTSLSSNTTTPVDKYGGLSIPIDWTTIENVYKFNQYTIKTGIILNFHTILLKTAQKVKKDSFINILIKKMTGSEEDMNIIEDLVKIKTLFSLEQLHLIAWYMAKHTKVLETKWFQVIGMTEKGVACLRDWVFCYYIFDIPDDSLKDYIVAFQERSMSDYILLKTTIKLIIHYKRDYTFHLPYSYCLRQIHSLRKLLQIDDHCPSPPLLGTSYECSGCLKFSNPIVHPIDYYPYDEDEVKNKKTNGGTNVTSSSPPPSNTTLAINNDNGNTENDLKKRIDNKQPLFNRRKKNQFDNTLTYQQQQRLKVELLYQNVLPSLNTTLYNIYNGNLYCARKPNKNLRKNATNHAIMSINASFPSPSISLPIPKKRVIMTSLDNSIIIESNRVVSNKKSIHHYPTDANGVVIKTFPLPSSTTVATTVATTTTTNDYDDLQVDEEDNNQNGEEDEDENDSIIRFEHDKDISNIHMLNENISSMALMLRNRAQTLIPETFLPQKKNATSLGTAEKPAKKSNKAIVNKFTNDPIQKYFSCQMPLKETYMIGIIKSFGKVLCCFCGAMTVAKNYNMTTYGYSCMRKATPCQTKDHPVWEYDKMTLHYRNLKLVPNYDQYYKQHLPKAGGGRDDEEEQEREMESPIITMIDDDQDDDQHDIKRNNAPSLLTKKATAAAMVTPQPQLDIKKSSTVRKRKIVDIYHKNDIINTSPFNPLYCHFCLNVEALLYITVQHNDTWKLMKIPVCYTCKRVIKNRVEPLSYFKNTR